MWGTDYRAMIVHVQSGLFAAALLLASSCTSPLPGASASQSASGACPQCERMVRGHTAFWHGVDLDGNLMGGTHYAAACPRCDIRLTAPCNWRTRWRTGNIKWSKVTHNTDD